MIQIPFLYVPIAGVCCYTILLLALAAAKKNRLIRSFMNLLGCYLLWTAGSIRLMLISSASSCVLTGLPYTLLPFIR